MQDQPSTNGDYRGPELHRVTNEAERRARIRFRITLAVNYRVLDAADLAGAGETLDISSTGVHFIAERELPVDTKLELTLRWPVSLEGSIPLQLRLVGTTVRVSGRQAALRIEHHEFRTRRPEISESNGSAERLAG